MTKPQALAPTLQGLGPSATLAINERSAALEAEGRRVFRMGLGQSPFPVPEVVVQALRQHAHEKDYLPVKGLLALRQAVADFHRRTQGLERRAEDVLIGPGSKELMFILQLAYAGQLVIPAPSWVSYAPQARLLGKTTRWVDTQVENDWKMTAQELEAVCQEDPQQARLLILNSPNNPSGVSYQAHELEALGEVARRFQVAVLSDEIYAQIHHQGDCPSIAHFYPERTIISSGLSKWCGAGGWRLGTFLFPSSLRWLLDAMAVVASETFTSTSAPIQYAAVRAFEGGPQIEDYLERSREVLVALGQWMAQCLREAGARVPQPLGGFYLMPDMQPLAPRMQARGIHNSQELAERLLQETGVACLPGSHFGLPAQRMVLRLAYVGFEGERALEAARRAQGRLSVQDLEEVCGDVVQGTRAMCQWLKEL